MERPRIHVRGKNEKPEKHPKQADTVNWNGPKERPLPFKSGRATKRTSEPKDYWSPYLKQHKRQRLLPPLGKAETKHQGRPQQSWLKLIASGGSAVLVGTLMGFLILKIFVGGGVPEQSNSIDSHIGEPSQPAESEQGGEIGDEEATVLPAMNTVWVQGGVYSTREGADELANAQRDRGLSAVVNQMEDQYRVFFGVGMTRDDALNIASEIKAAGVDVYLKDDFSTAAVSLDELPTEKGQKFTQLAEAGQSIVGRLGSLSTAGIGGEDIQETLANEVENIEALHRTFLSTLGEVKRGLSDHQRQTLNSMDQGLAQAVEAAKQYNQEASVPYLWQVQEGIMQYLIAYRQLGNSD